MSYGRNTPPRRPRSSSTSWRDPALDHRVDILESEHPRRADVPGQMIRVVDLDEDPAACSLDHPDFRERDRALSAILGVHGGLAL